MSSKMVIETKKASEYAVWEAGISPFLANWTLVYGNTSSIGASGDADGMGQVRRKGVPLREFADVRSI